MELLLASENEKKRRELQQLLAGRRISLLTPSDVGGLPPVDEDRETFAGNARKKALSAAKAAGRWTLADDSGLEVDALDGAPGVRSARFAGRHGDDAANNELLVERLADVPDERRGARFVCALCLASPDGEPVIEVDGTARGRILREYRGQGGFGYDPLFLFDEPGLAASGRTFAELEPGEKGEVGHRGRALRALIARLDEVLPERSGAR